ncbi:hypothetical protein QQ045_007298 [Rhodiola kirilowii]
MLSRLLLATYPRKRLLISTPFVSSTAMASFDSAASYVTIPNSPSRPRLRGVVFDMDGTLTVPVIDFSAMYKDVLGEEEYLAVKARNPSGIDILHHIETWTADEQQKAYKVIARFERLGIDRLQIMPGASELCSILDEKKIR